MQINLIFCLIGHKKISWQKMEEKGMISITIGKNENRRETLAKNTKS